MNQQSLHHQNNPQRTTASSMHISNDPVANCFPQKNSNKNHHPGSPTSQAFTASFASSLSKSIKPTFFDGMNIQSFCITKTDKNQIAAKPYSTNTKKQESYTTATNTNLNTTSLSHILQTDMQKPVATEKKGYANSQMSRMGTLTCNTTTNEKTSVSQGKKLSGTGTVKSSKMQSLNNNMTTIQHQQLTKLKNQTGGKQLTGWSELMA